MQHHVWTAPNSTCGCPRLSRELLANYCEVLKGSQYRNENPPELMPMQTPGAVIATHCLRTFAGMAAFPSAQAELIKQCAPSSSFMIAIPQGWLPDAGTMRIEWLGQEEAILQSALTSLSRGTQSPRVPSTE